MKFKSRNKDIIRLSSTIGHVCLIGEEWVEVPGHMESDAYSKGCISKEMFDTIRETIAKEEEVVEEEVVEIPAGDGVLDFSQETNEGVRNATIKEVINKMIDDPKASDFTARGKPNLAVLSERCEFPVPKALMEPVWDYIQDKRDKAEGDE